MGRFIFASSQAELPFPHACKDLTPPSKLRSYSLIHHPFVWLLRSPSKLINWIEFPSGKQKLEKEEKRFTNAYLSIE